MSDHCATHPDKPPNPSCYAYCVCRCSGCRAAKREKDRAGRAVRRLLNPEPRHKVDAAEVRRALQRAERRGYSDRQIARAAGMHTERVEELRHGRRTVVLRRTEARLLAAVEAVRSETPARADGQVVRGMLVWLRDRGAPDLWIAENTGLNKGHVWALRNRPSRPLRSTAVRVARLRDDVIDGRAVPPGHGPRARMAAPARGRAA